MYVVTYRALVAGVELQAARRFRLHTLAVLFARRVRGTVERLNP